MAVLSTVPGIYTHHTTQGYNHMTGVCTDTLSDHMYVWAM